MSVGETGGAPQPTRCRFGRLIAACCGCAIALPIIAWLFWIPSVERETHERTMIERDDDLITAIKATEGSFGKVSPQSVDLLERILFEPGCAQKITEVGIDLADLRDERWGCLKRFPNVSVIVVYDSRNVDDFLACLADMGQLEQLSLYKTDVSTAGLHCVAMLPRLKSFSLSRYPSKPDVAPLRGARTIETIAIEGFNETQVLGDWLEILKSMPALRGLALVDAHMSSEAKESVTRALPKCAVTYR